MHILVVDDKQAVLDLVTDILKGYGHSIETASNGLDAFEKAQKSPFDLFIIDHLMPVMNGIQLAKNLKHTDKTKDTEIVFMTTQDVSGVKALPEARLFKGIVAKPIDENLLMQLVETASKENTLLHSL